MNWKILLVLALIFAVFLFPAFSDEASLPKDWSSEELGRYLGNVLAYWKRVFAEASKRLTGQFSLKSYGHTRRCEFWKKV
jgi:hypothetical protein